MNIVSKIELIDKTEYRNKLGELHREDGPAVEHHNGGREWWINGKAHREDGPAFISVYGIKFWYLNSKNYTKEQHQEEVIKLKLERLKNL